ncbi:CAP domain-containing protein [Melaminivora sp.]
MNLRPSLRTWPRRASLLLALLGASAAALAQPAAQPVAAVTAALPTTGQAPTAPNAEQQRQLREHAASQRARALGDLDAGYQIDIHNREAVRLFYATVYASSNGVPSEWNGNVAQCQAGNTSVAYQQATLRRVNWLRAMAGLYAGVTFDSGFSAKAQQTALMMSAQGQLNHFPPPTWACYSAEGADGAKNSNLFLGEVGAAAMSGYVHDFGSSNAALGHRRWLLYPQTRVMGVGNVAPEGQGGAKTANALWVFDSFYGSARPAVRDDFVAWPAPGYMPWSEVYPRWSLSYPEADFSRASVRMTENGQPIATRLEPVARGFGEPTLVWIPSPYTDGMLWVRPAQDMVYTVQVDNVLVNGQPRSFSYSVTVFDPAAGHPGLAAPQGPTTLTVNQGGQYGVATSVAGAQAQWRFLHLGEQNQLQEGAEGDASSMSASTSPGYAVVTGDVAASGARSFHLAHASAQDQLLQLSAQWVPGSAAQLSFSSRLGLATPQQLALVEISLDGGASWQELQRQAGAGAGRGETQFTRKTISLAAYADRSIQLRWRYVVDRVAYYPQTDRGIGWYIDDIELTGAQPIVGTSPAAPVPAGGFSYASAVPGTVLLQARQGLYGFFDSWGQALRVQVAGGSLAPSDAQTECVLNWAERALPDLLHPQVSTRTDLPGMSYRYYSASGLYLAVTNADRQVYFWSSSAPQRQSLGRLTDYLAAAGCR